MKKENKKEGNYKLCWKYLKESKIYFLIIILVLFFSILVGFFYPVFLIELIKKFIEEIIAKTQGMNFFQLFLFIFKNNFMTALFGIILGVFFGIIPIVMVFFNGYVLGFVAGFSFREFGLISLWRLLPHGIFEMPALILSLGLGLKLARFIFAEYGTKKQVLKYDLENSLRVFLFVILPLLLIAGLIETALIFLLG